MKKIVLFVYMLIIAYISDAQENVYFRDDFNNNSNNWDLEDNRNANSEIENGHFVIKHKRKNSSWRFWKSIYLNVSKDFTIEAKMKQITGGLDNGYGLVWGSNGWGKSYSFVITSRGSFKVYGYKSEEYFEVQQWKKIGNIKPIGSYNNLKIVKKGDDLNFYVNDLRVLTAKFQPFFGSLTGFVLTRNMSVAIDYLEIKHPKVTINLVDNAITGKSKKNLGVAINTEYSEIAPVISPDGKTLYVARKNHPLNTVRSFYDIWVSHQTDEGVWSELQNVGKPLNNRGDNLVIAVTPDGNSILLEGTYMPDGSYKSDQGISISHRTASGQWGIPEEIVIENFYNNNEYESYSPSVDRQILIMSVERNDSYGIKDLYVSFLKDDNTYTEPMNLGTDINTYENEGTPFLAADNKTLYFYSYGHPGYGSADIFVTQRLDDTWKRWSTPRNLGPEINSSNWDTYYTIPASGEFAYLVSTEYSLGEEDIFQYRLTKSMKPEAVVLILGKVKDKKNDKPVAAQIVYEDLETGKTAGKATSNPVTGEYQIVLPYGRHYGLRADAKDYFSINENIDLRDKSEYAEIEKNLFLMPFEVGESVILNNVFFDRGKSDLKPASFNELKRVVSFMNANPTVKVEIGGHTEISHSDPKLSTDRAKAVRKYIVEQGISPERVIAVGYANQQPVTTEGGEHAQRKNRRVEFTILEK